MLVPRLLCPVIGRTVSLLPEFAASWLSSSLSEVEQVVRCVEQEGPRGAARRLRPDVDLRAAERWVRRRWVAVVAVMTVIRGLFPQLLAGCDPRRMTAFEVVLGTTFVLPALRSLVHTQLQTLRSPVGFFRVNMVHKPP
jgi:hypothetical protein